MSNLAGRSVAVLMPVYNDWLSAAHLLPLLDRIFDELRVSAHIVIVDDGSIDVSGRETIPHLSFSAISTVEEIILTRNQGNQKAMAIGLGYIASNLSVDYLVVMDSDHEDRPEYIPALLAKSIETGNRKVIFAERTQRSEHFTFRALYFAYKCIFRIATGVTISIGNFSVIPAALIHPIANIGELWSQFPVSIMRARIPIDRLPTKRGTRLFGATSMRVAPLVAHAFGGFAIYADIIAARGLLAAAMVSGGIVAVGILTVVLRLTTNIPLIGTASILIGLLGVMLLQVMGTSSILLFVTTWLRMQPPMIPFRDYAQFIVRTKKLWDVATSSRQSQSEYGVQDLTHYSPTLGSAGS
jgi:glycosyltransferase involved in cell wall biosynthesis